MSERASFLRSFVLPVVDVTTNPPCRGVWGQKAPVTVVVTDVFEKGPHHNACMPDVQVPMSFRAIRPTSIRAWILCLTSANGTLARRFRLATVHCSVLGM